MESGEIVITINTYYFMNLRNNEKYKTNMIIALKLMHLVSNAKTAFSR